MARWLPCIAVMSAVALAVPPAPAAAQSDQNFYEGRQIRLIVSAGEGGGYSAYARLLAAHIGSHIPGNPGVVVQNMPGAGGIRAANYIFANAPKDGTVFAEVHASAPLAPLFGSTAAQYDPRQFSWIGSLNRSFGMCVFWATSPIKTWSDLKTKTPTVGSSGAGSEMTVFPLMLNKLMGTHFKVINGYRDGNAVYLAMQRGEIDGRCGALLNSLKATRPDWLPGHQVNVPVILADRREPEFPDTPAIAEFVKDDGTRQQLRLMFASLEMERPLLAPPGVPPARLALLRAGFLATITDPAFAADAARQHLGIDYRTADQVLEVIDDAYAMPPDIVAAARTAMAVINE